MKLPYQAAWIDDRSSPPAWGRGLKRIRDLSGRNALEVAPRVGAWIETGFCRRKKKTEQVAPRVGAWIETWMR